MPASEHFDLTLTALKGWLIARAESGMMVGVLWLIGLYIIHVPWALLWAVIGGLAQFVPNVGPAIGLIGPGIAAAVSGDWMRLVYVLILYAIIVAADGFLIGPLLMKRAARVPVWASIIIPVLMGLLLGFWGVLLAAPLLAVVYAYRDRNRARVGLPPER